MSGSLGICFDLPPGFSCQAEFLPRVVGTRSIRSNLASLTKTCFIVFSERMPVNSLPLELVICGCVFKYCMTVSSGDSNLVCLIYTMTDCSIPSVKPQAILKLH